jgi:hypothetical protein
MRAARARAGELGSRVAEEEDVGTARVCDRRTDPVPQVRVVELCAAAIPDEERRGVVGAHERRHLAREGEPREPAHPDGAGEHEHDDGRSEERRRTGDPRR